MEFYYIGVTQLTGSFMNRLTHVPARGRYCGRSRGTRRRPREAIL